MSSPPCDWSALVLAGGRSSRLGQDKARATISGRSLLDHVVGSIPAAVACIVVGPRPASLVRSIGVATEPEPDGGPVAGIECGIAHVATPIVVVLAVDMPFAGEAAPRLLAALESAGPSVDAVVPVGAEGRRQPLAAAYRVAALRTALATLAPVRGRSMRDVLGRLNVSELAADELEARSLIDIDTSEDLDRARRTVTDEDREPQGEGPSMSDWVKAAAAALDIPGDVDVDAILDVAREAAHGVERPAAPVSTYLMGYAVARGMTVDEAGERITRLARDWPPAP